MIPNSSCCSFEKILGERGVLVYTNRGNSMHPLIKEGKDVLVITSQIQDINLFDIILTKRPSGRYLLHRIVRKNNDGTFDIAGDNSYKCDRGIKPTEIIGKLTTIIRDDKKNELNSLKYKIYVLVWCRFFFIRKPILHLKKIFS